MLLASGEQIVELFAGNACAVVEVFAVIEVRGAHHRRAFPRKHEHRAPIARMQKGERLRHRQTPTRQQQMTAAQRSQLPWCLSRTQPFGPWAGGNGQHTRAQLQRRPALAIFHLNPAHPPAFTQQLRDPHTIEHHRAIGPSLA